MPDVGTVEEVVAVNLTDGGEGFVAGLAEGFTGHGHRKSPETWHRIPDL